MYCSLIFVIEGCLSSTSWPTQLVPQWVGWPCAIQVFLSFPQWWLCLNSAWVWCAPCLIFTSPGDVQPALGKFCSSFDDSGITIIVLLYICTLCVCLVHTSSMFLVVAMRRFLRVARARLGHRFIFAVGRVHFWLDVASLLFGC